MIDITTQESVRVVEGGVCAPLGFSASSMSCGIRASGRKDLALIAADEDCTVAAVFTQNLVVAAPVIVSREAVADGLGRAVIINSGNANAATGEAGLAASRATVDALAAALGCESGRVVVSSTGVIGVPLPVEKIVDATPALVAGLERSIAASSSAAEAIMTTDLFPKEVAVEVDIAGAAVRIGAIAKGSGMIAPNMATMLAVVTTDAALSADAADAALRAAVGVSLNRVTVDSDTSTNDMCAMLANGAAGGLELNGADLATFTEALTDVLIALARSVARDGEGATKLVSVTVSGAATEDDAATVAKTIAESPLVKTALFGKDANWGRVAAAAGRSGVAFDQGDLAIDFLGIPVCRNGTAVPFSEEEALARFGSDEVTIDVDLGVGDEQATVWTCDFSYDYVRINGDYRT